MRPPYNLMSKKNMYQYIRADTDNADDKDLFEQPFDTMDKTLGRPRKNYLQVPQQPGIEDVRKADEVIATHTVHEWRKFEDTLARKERRIGQAVDLCGRQGLFTTNGKGTKLILGLNMMDKGITALSSPSYLRGTLKIPQETRIVCAGTAGQLGGDGEEAADIGLIQDGNIQVGGLSDTTVEKRRGAGFSPFIHQDERVQTSLLPERYYYKEKSSYQHANRGTFVATQYDLEWNAEVDEACLALGLKARKGPTWTSQHKLECGSTSALTTRGYVTVEMEDAYLKSQDQRILILRGLADRGEENQNDDVAAKNSVREAATDNIFRVLQFIYDK